MVARHEVYLSVDVEADGPLMGVHSLLSLGACVAGVWEPAGGFAARPVDAVTFYAELRPGFTEVVPEALAVSGLDRDRLLREGEEPAAAMGRFVGWVRDAAAAEGGARPVVVAWPASYDWPWLSWHLGRFAPGSLPFGHSSCLDMKTLYAVKAGVPLTQATKGAIPRALRSRRRHTHHALDDAQEQGELFAALMRWQPSTSQPR